MILRFSIRQSAVLFLVYDILLPFVSASPRRNDLALRSQGRGPQAEQGANRDATGVAWSPPKADGGLKRERGSLPRMPGGGGGAGLPSAPPPTTPQTRQDHARPV